TQNQESEVQKGSPAVKETWSPAMDILVSSNFERLLWFLAFKIYGQGDVDEKRKTAGNTVRGWLQELSSKGGFGVEKEVLEAAQQEFESERVSDEQTIDTIRSVYSSCLPPAPASAGTRGETGGYILDPHSAIGVAASQRSISRCADTFHISLSTAHPAKFAEAVDAALRNEKGYSFDNVLPPEFVGLEKKERRVIPVPAGATWKTIGEVINSKVSI
ncbi:hypothetical protein FQN49_008747, partial [Arthroderma sp. PD_2]